MRIKAICGLALSVALAGCGGGSSSDEKTSSAKPDAADSAKVEKLLEQTFGPNPKASSGVISGTVDIDVKGVPDLAKPIQITVSGPFSQSGSDAPEANLSVGLSLRDGSLGGEMILVEDRAFIALGSTAYPIPDSITANLRKPLANSDNALASVLAVFGIAPRRWAKNARIVGNESIAGVDTIHGTADIDAERFFLDVAKLTKTLTSLRITDITGLPRVIDRKARVALARSVKSASGEIYTGADDHVMRRASFTMTLKPSARDRKRLGGVTSLKIGGGLDITDVGSPKAIAPPSGRGSYEELQTTLDALAEAVKK